MTGFGAAEGSALGGRLRIEIRTVNHRYYNPQLKLPFELAAIEAQLRDRLRQLLDRGHVAVTARWLQSPAAEGTVAVDLARARQVVAALKQLKKQLRPKGEPHLAFVARQPDVLMGQAAGARDRPARRSRGRDRGAGAPADPSRGVPGGVGARGGGGQAARVPRAGGAARDQHDRLEGERRGDHAGSHRNEGGAGEVPGATREPG